MAVKKKKTATKTKTATKKKTRAARRSHISLDTFEREARAADRARSRAALDSGAAPADATRVRARRRVRVAPAAAAAPEPPSFDLLRDAAGNRIGTQVRDQGSAGSCTANAAISAMETFRFVRDNTAPLLSPEDAFQKAGGIEEMGVAVVIAAQGILETGCFTPNPPCANQATHTWRGTFRQLTESINNMPAAMRSHLLAQRPLAAVIRFFPNFRNYTGGVFKKEGTSTAAHAVAVVGYEKNSSGNGGVWICRNSFGPAWGEQGYVKTEWLDGFLELEHIVFVLEDVRRAG